MSLEHVEAGHAVELEVGGRTWFGLKLGLGLGRARVKAKPGLGLRLGLGLGLGFRTCRWVQGKREHRGRCQVANPNPNPSPSPNPNFKPKLSQGGGRAEAGFRQFAQSDCVG